MRRKVLSAFWRRVSPFCHDTLHFWIYFVARSDGNNVSGMPWWRHHFTAMIGSKTLGAATTLSKRNIHAVAFALLFVTCKPLVSTELCNQVSDFVTVALTCWRLFRFWLTHHQKEKSLTEYNSLAFSGSDHCWQRRCAFCSGVKSHFAPHFTSRLKNLKNWKEFLVLSNPKCEDGIFQKGPIRVLKKPPKIFDLCTMTGEYSLSPLWCQF